MQVALSAFFSSVVPAEAQSRSLFGGSDVVEYVPATFNSTVLSDPRVWIVVYYADWCGHCIHYSPVFKRMAAELLKEQARLRLGALNCAVHHQFCGEIGVRSYPTVRSYHIAGVKESWTREGGDVARNIVHSERLFPEWVLKRLPAASSSSGPPPALRGAAPPPAAAAQPTAAPAPASTAAPSASAAVALGASAGGDAGAAVAAASASAAPAPARAGERPGEGGAALRLVDAEVALLYSLRQGAFLAATTSAGQPPQLQGTALAELHAWLEFLALMLPSHQACEDVRALAAVVAEAQDSASGALLEDAWTQALDGQGIDSVPPQAGRDPTPYWRVCRSYTCGLWTLFHMITLAAAEGARVSGHRFLAERGSGLPTPSQALLRLRGFVAHFFGCQECASHFLQTFDSCGYDGCRLDPLDGEGAAIWLWQVHRGVTKRVAAEGGARGSATAVAAPALWPPKAECGECWKGGGEDQWDASLVYAYLKASYWQADWAPGGLAASGAPDFALAGGLLALAALGYFLWRFLAAGGCLHREKGS